MPSVFLSAALAGAALLSAHAAQASTVVLNNWAFGRGNNVHAVQPAYEDAAGGFTGKLDGKDLLSYCVELSQDFDWKTSYTNYTDQTALAYFGAASDKALKLARLVSYAYYDSTVHVSTAAQSTSMQLAVWNVIYDVDYALSSGTFADTSAYAAYASSLLKASQSFVNVANVWILASPTQQDQLHWDRVSVGRSSNAQTAVAVAEPGSLALALAAIGVAAAALRRRG